MLAREEVKTRRWDQSAARFAGIIDQSQDGPEFDAPKKSIGRELAQWDEVFNRVVKLRPEESTLWIGRGQYHILRSQWTQASADFAKVIHARPASYDEANEYSFALLLLEQSEAYRQFCKELIDRGSDPQSVADAFQMARTFAAGKQDAVDPSRVVEWAQRGIDFSPNGGWVWHVFGLARYRAGQYEAATKSLERSNDLWRDPEKALNWLVLAMVHQRLGHSDDAHKCLETGRSLIEKVQPHKPDEPVVREDGSSLPPPDWVEMNALLRETDR
jgi:tetratricopeptide (TPR) repeat protein